MDIYWDEELHRHRPGRTYGRLVKHQFENGYNKLDQDLLPKLVEVIQGVDMNMEEEKGEGENGKDGHEGAVEVSVEEEVPEEVSAEGDMFPVSLGFGEDGETGLESDSEESEYPEDNFGEQEESADEQEV